VPSDQNNNDGDISPRFTRGSISPRFTRGGQHFRVRPERPAKFFQGFVQGQELQMWRGGGHFDVRQLLTAAVPAGLETSFVSDSLDEYPSHGLGRCGEEMATTVPFPGRIAVHETQVRLMDQGGGLEGLAGRFMGHLPCR
jgi:hypothetical protein